MSNKGIKMALIIAYDLGSLEEGKEFVDTLFYKECDKLFVTLSMGFEAEVNGITILKPVQTIIEDKLLSLCTNNEANLIIITDNVESAERDCVKGAIEAVINNKHPRIVEDSITNIKTKIEEIAKSRIACGIRDKTLIVNLPDPYKYNYSEEIARVLLSTWYLIHEKTDIDAAMPLIYLAYSSNRSEQKKDEDANKSADKASPSCSSSLREDMKFYDQDNTAPELISLDDALEKLNSIANAHGDEIYPEFVDVSDAYGRILCEEVLSNCYVPPCRTSRKHGYAVIALDGKGLKRMLNNENGFPPISLERGTCMWVNSGDPVPNEATAVIPERDTKTLVRSPNNGNVHVDVMKELAHGQNINPIDCDIMKGKVIIKPFTCIGPEEMGLLAASGYEEVVVTSQLSIGVLSIGDNLEEPGKSLKPGYVYDINRITLITLLKQNGFSALDFGIVNNTLPSIHEKIKKALRIVDVLVTTGSDNDKYLLKIVLEKHFEACIHFGHINIKPGRTTTLATCKIKNKMKYFLCLSENPLSAFVTAHIFLLPMVKNMCRKLFSDYSTIPVSIDRPIVLHNRRRFLWSYFRWDENESLARASNIDDSLEDRLINIVRSNALLILPERTEELQRAPEDMLMSGLLVDFPEKFDSLLTKFIQSLKKKDE